MEINFGEWLRFELQKKEWSQTTIANKSGLSTGQISRLISGTRSPGTDTCNALASALGYPPETVYRAAGLLPDLHTPRDLYEEEIHYRLSLMDDDQLAKIKEYIEFISTHDQKPVKVREDKPLITKNREGSRPPEVVKK